MQTNLVLGAGAVLATALLLSAPGAGSPTDRAAAPDAGPTAPPPVAQGHHVLVVEGDRNGLDVTFARHKQAPWAGVPKGLESDWQLVVRDAAGGELARIPLDVRPFATGAGDVGRAARVRGCVVVDSRIGMLVNVPAFATAARYEFSRGDGEQGRVALGAVTAGRLRELLEAGR